jgi:hypothetical protein
MVRGKHGRIDNIVFVDFGGLPTVCVSESLCDLVWIGSGKPRKKYDCNQANARVKALFNLNKKGS